MTAQTETALVIDTNSLDVPYREIWYVDGIISRDRNSIPPEEFDPRYPPTPYYQSIGAIKIKTNRAVMYRGFQGTPQSDPMMPRDIMVSRSVVRLIGVIFPVWCPIATGTR